MEPLTKLLKNHIKWRWEKEQQEPFEDLKRRLTTAPISACPYFNKLFTLQTDASESGVGAALVQNADGQDRVIAYTSRTLSATKCHCSVIEKECLSRGKDEALSGEIPLHHHD